MKAFSFFFIAFALVFTSCSEGAKKKSTELPSNSIFHLASEWKDQNGKDLQLNDLRGKTLGVVMIYTSCQSACPILVAKMKQIEQKISRDDIKDVSLILVSIDPETDTPERLKEFARKNKMDGSQWTFLTSNEDATQEFANVLAMKYKKISPIDFSHSNIITVFSPDGQLVQQEEGLEIDVEKVATLISKVVKENK